MDFTKTTEQDSHYSNLEQKTIRELLETINNEDQSVPKAVAKVLPQIERLVKKVTEQLQQGGRLFYIGAGTSGRLGVLDASECPPTFGVPHDLVIGLIAGGDSAIRKAVEFAEDDNQQGWKDLELYNINSIDIVVGIAASGTTPYVIGALKKCQKQHIPTACISCNVGSPLAAVSDFPIEVVVGPEVVTGSSRMKAGTAQKLILNMITTSAMIQLGRIKDNKMVDMQLSNHKIVDRGIRMLINELNISKAEAKKLLETHQNVRAAINAHKHG
ncbi:MAG: N-acetylmuramic acid 6-phosphate etherase [Bacteroidetes bacterium]|nr:N-acetylmuramic acid 6-phosphate etherase [Bacteroidota bacterium]MDA1175892.1 N-acetylmuramic acid 6-phosphate etherase [Bacteroidota bacterium]